MEPMNHKWQSLAIKWDTHIPRLYFVPFSFVCWFRLYDVSFDFYFLPAFGSILCERIELTYQCAD